jgi:DNA repair protein RadC
MKITQLPSFTRPREKLSEKGADALSDAELLAILLRTGYTGRSALEISRRMLRRNTLPRLLNLSLTQLADLKGVGSSRASILVACTEIARRLNRQDQSTTIKTPHDVAQVAQFLIAKKQEHLLCLYVNARNQLLAQEVVSVGTVNSSLIHPREVFAPALQHRAAGVIVVHNHPSGETLPSEEDIITTEKLVEAGNLLDIPILDHVIVGKNGWSSLKQEQLI